MSVTIHELSLEAIGHFHFVRHPLLDCRVQFGVSGHAMELTIGSGRSRGNELKPLNTAASLHTCRNHRECRRARFRTCGGGYFEGWRVADPPASDGPSGSRTPPPPVTTKVLHPDGGDSDRAAVLEIDDIEDSAAPYRHRGHVGPGVLDGLRAQDDFNGWDINTAAFDWYRDSWAVGGDARRRRVQLLHRLISARRRQRHHPDLQVGDVPDPGATGPAVDEQEDQPDPQRGCRSLDGCLGGPSTIPSSSPMRPRCRAF